MSESRAAEPGPAKRSRPMPAGDRNNNPEGIGFWALIAEDFRTHDRDPLAVGFWAVAFHRFGNWRMGVRSKSLRAPMSCVYRGLYIFVKLFFTVDLPYNMTLGRRLRIWHHGGIYLGACSIGDDVHLRHNVTMGVVHRGEGNAKPTIGNRVDIGPGAAILGSVEVGDDVVIGANSVVVRDVPPNSTVFGVPARPVNLKSAAGTRGEEKG